MHDKTKQWRKLTGEKITAYIEDEVRGAILRERKMGSQLKVCIGTDSQVRGATQNLQPQLCLSVKVAEVLCT